ncbi:MAG: homoserine dehydrogenase, partial [Bacteroidota bacterium]
MPHYRLSFIGFGNVARSLARLLERKSDVMKQLYDITYSVTGIATGKHGFAVNPDGIDVDKALELFESGQSISSLSSIPMQDSVSVIQNSQADVMFENSPVNTR